MPTEDDRFEFEFRGALQDLAARVRSPVSVPPRAVKRARARLGRNVAAGALAVAMVAVGGARAIQVIQEAPQPVTTPTPSASTTTPSEAATPFAPLRVPTAARPLRALVVGDAFAEGLETSLAGITDSTYFRIIPWGLSSTGLSRSDYYDWPRALSGFLQQYRPDIVIIMLGGNDPQTISTRSGGRIPLNDPRWRQAYRRRVDRMMATASANGTHVAWISMPIMGDPVYSRSIERIDSIDRAEAARHPSVAFVDTWRMVADRQGHYADRLPDEQGNLKVVRSSDKIHLSAAGNRILADAVIQVMREHAGWHLSQRALG